MPQRPAQAKQITLQRPVDVRGKSLSHAMRARHAIHASRLEGALQQTRNPAPTDWAFGGTLAREQVFPCPDLAATGEPPHQRHRSLGMKHDGRAPNLSLGRPTIEIEPTANLVSVKTWPTRRDKSSLIRSPE